MTGPVENSSGLGRAEETGAEPQQSAAQDLRRSLATKDGLGAALTKQGRYDEAATLLQEVLKARTDLGYTKDDLNMVRTMNNLAAALGHQGHFAEAEVLAREVYESDGRNLGREDTNTIISMINLANNLNQQGKFDEAEIIQRQALESSSKVRGPLHHETMSISTTLENDLRRQGKHEQAEIVKREMEELQQNSMLTDQQSNQGTNALTSDLPAAASTLDQRHKRLADAETLYRREVTDARTDTEKMASINKLAGVLVDRGNWADYNEAETLLRDALKLSAGAVGSDDTGARLVMTRLADVLIRNGKYEEAETLHRQVLVMGAA